MLLPFAVPLEVAAGDAALELLAAPKLNGELPVPEFVAEPKRFVDGTVEVLDVLEESNENVLFAIFEGSFGCELLDGLPKPKGVGLLFVAVVVVEPLRLLLPNVNAAVLLSELKENPPPNVVAGFVLEAPIIVVELLSVPKENDLFCKLLLAEALANEVKEFLLLSTVPDEDSKIDFVVVFEELGEVAPPKLKLGLIIQASAFVAVEPPKIFVTLG